MVFYIIFFFREFGELFSSYYTIRETISNVVINKIFAHKVRRNSKQPSRSIKNKIDEKRGKMMHPWLLGSRA